MLTGMRRHDRKMAAFESALRAFRAGLPHLGELRVSARAELDDLREKGVERVKALACGGSSCPACLAVAGQVFDVETAIRAMPLPVAGCTHVLDRRIGWCRCEWVAQLNDYEE